MINGDSAINIWLQIAGMAIVILTAAMMAIATLFGPSLAEITKALMAMPKPTPDEKKPKKRSQRMSRWLIKVLSSNRTSAVALLLNIVILIIFFAMKLPIDHAGLLIVASGVGGIVYQSLRMSIRHHSRLLQDVAAQAEQNREAISKILEKQGEQLKLPAKQPENAGTLQALLKKLVGE